MVTEQRETDGLLTIGEMTERTGVSSATLRSWEERVGFPVPVRSSGGQRRYRAADADLVGQVLLERDRGLSLGAAVAAVRRQDVVGAESVYAGLRRAHPQLEVLRVGFRVMRSLTSAIEDECLAQASRPVLFGGFQTRRSFEITQQRWRELARGASAAVVLSDFEQTDPDGTPQRVALPARSPMLNEWSLVCHDPQLSVALVAWEVPHPRDDNPERRFEAVLTLEPEVVEHASLMLAAAADQHGLDGVRSVVSETSAGIVEDSRRSAALLRRFVSYADQQIAG